MGGFTDERFLIFLTVIVPFLLLASAVYLGSNICAIIAILVWIGVGTTILYLPHVKE